MNSLLLEKGKTSFADLFMPSFFIISVIFFGHYLHLKNYHVSKWISYLLSGLSIPLIFIFYQKMKTFYSSKQKIASIFVLTVFSGIIAKSLKSIYIANTLPFTLGVLFFILSISILTIYFLKNHIYEHYLNLIFFLLISFFSLTGLTNTEVLLDSFKVEPLVCLLALFSCYSLAFVFIFHSNAKKKLSRKSHLLIITTAALLLFAALSFRYDTFFSSKMSEFHGEFFAGPIRLLKQGSWLLWDAPSQYGFLNILLASLIPTKTAWQALYIFQGMLLLITAFIMYYVMQSQTKHLFIGLLLIVCSLFSLTPY